MRYLRSPLVPGALVFALTWGGGLVAPVAPSLDYSFHAGLQLAEQHGLDFGGDLAATYGPLGFLKSYMLFEPGPSRLATLYGLALHGALCVSLVWALRRNFGAMGGVLLALAIAVLARGDQSAIAVRDDAGVVILAVIWCVAALAGRSPELTRRVVLIGGPPFAALELLAKLSTGLVVVVLLAIAAGAVAGNRRRNLALAGGAFALCTTALWLLSGQGASDAGRYLAESIEIASGYSSGARLEWNEHAYDYPLAALLIAGAGALVWIGIRGFSPPRRAGAVAAFCVVAYSAAKAGFVSHDVFHMATFYATLLAVVLVVPLPRAGWLKPASLALAALALGGAATTFFDGYPMTNPVTNVSDAAGTLAALARPGEVEDRVAANRAALRATYGIAPELLAELDDDPTHVDPSETAAAWAYGLDWRPLPVFQPYMAWTPSLDERNGEVAASPTGPQRILRHEGNPLGRYPGFESPAAMREILCNFRAAATAGGWQVLERIPNRCGPLRPLGTRTGSYGEAIRLPDPPAGHALVGRVEGVDVAGLERLRTLLLRARGRQVQIGDDPTRYTLIPGTAADGLLLSVPPRLDFPGGFALAPEGEEITFYLDGGSGGDADAIRLELLAMPLSR